MGWNHFFDVRLAIWRGAFYILSIIALAITFFTVEFCLEKFVYNNDEVVDIFCAVIGAIVFYYCRSWFDRVTDAIFFRREYDYAKAINEIGPLLNSTIDLKFLLRLIYEFLLRTIKPEKVIFIFDEASSPMFFGGKIGARSDPFPERDYQELAEYFFAHFKEPVFFNEALAISDEHLISIRERMQIGAIVPLASDDEPRALMLLGRKLSDDIFRAKDTQLITVLSHQAGMAIRNARLYEEIRHYNEILELRVAERTDKIRKIYESQSKFLTDVSHELQTPIAILRGNMEVLQKRMKKDTEGAMHVMATTLDGMARLVNDLLEGARLKFSKNTFYKKEIKVGLLLQEIFDGCLILVEDKGMVMSLVSEELLIVADRDKLREVFLNLISNALKHTKAAGAISLIAEKSGDSARITVQDTGDGIAPEELPHIFDRFYKIGTDGVRGMAGTGIGLNICRQIIEAHGGRIMAESDVGKGSRFIVDLPLASP
jgi:signal transduction histidine kinase